MPDYGQGVAGATVTLFHELAADGGPVRESTWPTTTSTADGMFRLYSYATPGSKNLVGLEVSAGGYRTVYTTYWDYFDPDEQSFLVVLEPAAHQ